MNRECRRWSSGVHSTYSNCPTNFGLNHRQSFIFSAVRPCPHRPLLASGRFTKGQSASSSPRNPSIQVLSRCRCKATARPCHIDEIGATVVAKGQGVEVLGARCISCDHELLPPIEPHLLPCAGALTGFVRAVQSFCDQSFQSLRAYGINQVRETGIQFGRMANGLAQFWKNTLAQQFTVDVLYGVGVLRNAFGVQVSS